MKKERLRRTIVSGLSDSMAWAETIPVATAVDADTEDMHSCTGFCPRCQKLHTLPLGSAKRAAFDLIRSLDREKRLDFHLPPDKADPRLSTDYLFGKARGKMFGTLVCQGADGSVHTLKAFSGQYNGQWGIEGWAPPLFDLKRWHRINDDTERRIKQMGVKIAALGEKSFRGSALSRKRKELSRGLMKEIHGIYDLHNFCSDCRPLSEVFIGVSGIPNGTADCCAPKLLNTAARKNLRPLGLVEFYYGRENKKGTRMHKSFYPPCREKCRPILGFLLCGV